MPQLWPVWWETISHSFSSRLNEHELLTTNPSDDGLSCTASIHAWMNMHSSPERLVWWSITLCGFFLHFGRLWNPHQRPLCSFSSHLSEQEVWPEAHKSRIPIRRLDISFSLVSPRDWKTKVLCWDRVWTLVVQYAAETAAPRKLTAIEFCACGD